MRAIGIMVHGGPEALEVVDLPEVHAGPGQVRVRIYTAAVNLTDTMARNGSRAEQQKVDPPPYVPGMDVAGIVDEVGDGIATGVRVGDAVMAMVVPKGSHGAYREQIVLQIFIASFNVRWPFETQSPGGHSSSLTLPSRLVKKLKRMFSAAFTNLPLSAQHLDFSLAMAHTHQA